MDDNNNCSIFCDRYREKRDIFKKIESYNILFVGKLNTMAKIERVIQEQVGCTGFFANDENDNATGVKNANHNECNAFSVLYLAPICDQNDFLKVIMVFYILSFKIFSLMNYFFLQFDLYLFRDFFENHFQ